MLFYTLINSHSQMSDPGTFCLMKLIFFFKKSCRFTNRLCISLDRDEGGCCVGPDLGPNHLKRLLADNNRT